jgi:hypothetical protein
MTTCSQAVEGRALQEDGQLFDDRLAQTAKNWIKVLQENVLTAILGRSSRKGIQRQNIVSMRISRTTRSCTLHID